MKRCALIIFVAIFSAILFCSCKHDKGLILFNSEPISEKNALHDQKHFKTGQRIYYLFIAPQKMDNEYIRIQVFKMTDKAAWGGYEVLRTKDYRLMLNERYYHTDYFTLHQKGRYIMQVFSHDDFVRPLAFNDFYVK